MRQLELMRILPAFSCVLASLWFAFATGGIEDVVGGDGPACNTSKPRSVNCKTHPGVSTANKNSPTCSGSVKARAVNVPDGKRCRIVMLDNNQGQEECTTCPTIYYNYVVTHSSAVDPTTPDCRKN